MLTHACTPRTDVDNRRPSSFRFFDGGGGEEGGRGHGAGDHRVVSASWISFTLSKAKTHYYLVMNKLQISISLGESLDHRTIPPLIWVTPPLPPSPQKRFSRVVRQLKP